MTRAVQTCHATQRPFVIRRGREHEPTNHIRGPCRSDACEWIFVAVPDHALTVANGRWALFTGHIDDPLAETCHWGYPPAMEHNMYDAAARQQCRGSFVVETVKLTTAPSP